MTAKEARVKAFDVNTSGVNSQYSEILLLIEASAQKGAYDVSYYKPLLKDVKDRLEQDGYTVKTSFDRNESYVTINW